MMDKRERKALAEQLTANPLLEIVLGEIEASAVEQLIYSTDEIQRLECQMRVRAVRSFRSDLADALSTREPKAAPA